jgi:transposase InsO family protein
MVITRPNQVWAMDINYIPMARGFVYLAVVLDWVTRRVLSWRLSTTMEAAFCVETLEDALARRGKPGASSTPTAVMAQRQNTRRCICGPMKASARRATRSAAMSTSTIAADQTLHLSTRRFCSDNRDRL